MARTRGTDKIGSVDSNGRIAAGTPGQYYRVEHGEQGVITLTPIKWIAATSSPKRARAKAAKAKAEA